MLSGLICQAAKVLFPNMKRLSLPSRRLLALESLEERWCPADTEFTGAVSGDWFLAGNWSNGVPTPSMTVEINSPTHDPWIPGMDSETGNPLYAFAEIVTLSSSFAGHSLQLDTGASLEVTYDFIHGAGTVSFQDVEAIAVDGDYFIHGGCILASSGGTLDSSSVVVNGTFMKTGTGTATVTTTIVATNELRVHAGDLKLNIPGHIYIGPNASLTLTSSRSSGDGNITADDPDDVTITLDSGATLQRVVDTTGYSQRESPGVTVAPLIEGEYATIHLGPQARVDLVTHGMVTAVTMTDDSLISIGSKASFGKVGEIVYATNSTVLCAGEIDGDVSLPYSEFKAYDGAYILGSLTITYGGLLFDTTTNYLTVSGDLYLTASLLDMSIVYDTQNLTIAGNYVSVSGYAAVAECTLQAVVNATPGNGSSKDFWFIRCSSGAAYGDDGDGFDTEIYPGGHGPDDVYFFNTTPKGWHMKWN